VLNKYFWLAVSWTVFVTVLCLISTDSFSSIANIDIDNTDKYVHSAFYFVLTMAWLLFFKAIYGNTVRVRSLVFSAAVSYGIIVEICQLLFTESRSGDAMDVLANGIGSAAAIGVIWLYKRNKRIVN